MQQWFLGMIVSTIAPIETYLASLAGPLAGYLVTESVLQTFDPSGRAVSDDQVSLNLAPTLSQLMSVMKIFIITGKLIIQAYRLIYILCDGPM